MKSDSTAPTGHWPTLVACFLHFDISFMLWVLLGALGIYVAEELKLSPADKGLMVAVPILSGSLMRLPMGLLSDRLGSKGIGMVMLSFLFIPLLGGWLSGTNLNSLLGIGVMLGTAGASFSVALPLASRWYPANRQGLVMGIAAAGNSGTVIANLAAPRLADIVGWHNVLGLAMVPLALVLVAFALMAKDSANRTAGLPIRHYLSALRHGDMWWFCLFYSITFGGYVGLSSFLPLFLRDQYNIPPVMAGYLTALAAFVGSAIRPVGGLVADKVGGARLLAILLLCIGLLYSLGTQLPPLGWMTAVVVATMICLGMGNGAIFQLVPQRFAGQIGIATGVVGALGGIGGFGLPTLLGNIKQATGSFSRGFLFLGLASLSAFVMLQVLVKIREGWRFSWRMPHTLQAAGPAVSDDGFRH